VAVVWSIVVAGGSGQRFGQPKQFTLLGGRPVVSHSVAACAAWSDGTVLVLPAGTDQTFGADIVVEGGTTRSDSVRHGLRMVPEEAEVIVVHDAARPLAGAELFKAVLAAVADGADGAVPGLPVRDTIKQVDGNGLVLSTLDRATLVAVQTPQAFRADALRRAHADEGSATDDAALVEASGGAVSVVPGDERNLKITTPEDLRSAEGMMGARG
jgi:2-C-methyl-D-erythritol 4-phosphate cytidylyltransferase